MRKCGELVVYTQLPNSLQMQLSEQTEQKFCHLCLGGKQRLYTVYRYWMYNLLLMPVICTSTEQKQPSEKKILAMNYALRLNNIMAVSTHIAELAQD